MSLALSVVNFSSSASDIGLALDASDVGDALLFSFLVVPVIVLIDMESL